MLDSTQWFSNNTTSAIGGAGIAYPSGVHKFTHDF